MVNAGAACQAAPAASYGQDIKEVVAVGARHTCPPGRTPCSDRAHPSRPSRPGGPGLPARTGCTGAVRRPGRCGGRCQGGAPLQFPWLEGARYRRMRRAKRRARPYRHGRCVSSKVHLPRTEKWHAPFHRRSPARPLANQAMATARESIQGRRTAGRTSLATTVVRRPGVRALLSACPDARSECDEGQSQRWGNSRPGIGSGPSRAFQRARVRVRMASPAVKATE